MTTPSCSTVLFCGTPKSGKTVYFSVIADYLTHLCARNRDCRYRFFAANNDSVQFVDDVLAAMKKGEWPLNTIAPANFEYALILKGKIWDNENRLIYGDYPGEVFQATYGDHRKYSAQKVHIDKLKADMDKASGVCLLVDTVQLHDGGERHAILDCLSGFGRAVRGSEKKKRIAVVFTKKDCFLDGGSQDFDPEKTLCVDYPDAYQLLNEVHAKYFFVSSVANPIVDSRGSIVPPSGYKSKNSINVLEPICWILKINRGDFKE